MALLRLPAPSLRGTFAKAYAILTQLVNRIGWDELLKTRSTIFVMEEEYRVHKSNASKDINGHDDETASTTAIRSTSPATGIPIIRISSESTRGAPGSNGLEGPANPQEPGSTATAKDADAETTSTFSNKRLCERWLGKPA